MIEKIIGTNLGSKYGPIHIKNIEINIFDSITSFIPFAKAVTNDGIFHDCRKLEKRV